MITLSNERLSLHVREEGAEICSLIGHTTQREYLWQGDPQYWKRHAPVLFPIVGSVWEGTYRVKGTAYHLSQHGFARDTAFEVVRAEKEQAIFRLRSSAETLAVYPYPFILDIAYELQRNTVKVTWTVENPSDEDIFFQIGAHPAFNYPDFHKEDAVKGYLRTGTDSMTYRLLGEKGCLHTAETYTLQSKTDGLYSLRPALFDKDALVIEGSQLKEVALLDREKRPYLRVDFDAPIVGLWSPAGKNAPFLCIEPWYGRCDAEHYTGDFREKAAVNRLEPHGLFKRSYTITIEA